MRAKRAFLTAGVIAWGVLLSSCGTAWKMDYGEPAAQFEGKDVHTKGAEYVDQKVTVRGTVTGYKADDDGIYSLVLEDTIYCVLSDYLQQLPGGPTNYYPVGERVYMDGFLREVSPEKVVISPSAGRDHTAPFEPK